MACYMYTCCNYHDTMLVVWVFEVYHLGTLGVYHLGTWVYHLGTWVYHLGTWVYHLGTLGVYHLGTLGVYHLGTLGVYPRYLGIPPRPRVYMAHPEDSFYRHSICGRTKVFFFHPILTHTHPNIYRITYPHSFLKIETFCFRPYFTILSHTDGHMAHPEDC